MSIDELGLHGTARSEVTLGSRTGISGKKGGAVEVKVKKSKTNA
jgi:hypothetical protein